MNTPEHTHPVHTGFVSPAERDAVMRDACAVSSPDADLTFWHRAWGLLCAERAGGPLPVPMLAQFRAWDLAAVVDVDLAPYGDLDAYNARPEQQGFASPEERIHVLAEALVETPGATLRNLPYAAVWRALCRVRGGTALAIPSYKHLRSRWDAAIQDGPR